MAELERASRDGDFWLFSIRWDPAFDTMRDDPRFQSILKKFIPLRIGNELGVKAVISWRIVQHGENLTISVELVDVRNNKLLWGEQYDR